MTVLEHQLLEELYFTISFEELLSRIDMKNRGLAKIELERMIRQGYITQMMYDVSKNDYEKLTELNSGLLENSYFVATRKGLLAHNGM